MLIEILKVVGVMLLVFAGFLLLNLIAFWQVTWNMTPEEKESFVKYIEENGLFNDPDDFY